ncbi:MAG: stage III sporulation protein AB [Clostridiales bacterium]|nr:stage III sporulation protein AB [Clostridiales bacterium]
MICSVLSGTAIRSRMKKRIALLRKILILLDITESQISFVNTDIISLLTILTNNKNLSELGFLNDCLTGIQSNISFDEAWNNAVNSFKSALNEEDKSFLISFGSQLGKSDINGQKSNCELHKLQLECRIDDAREKYKKRGNLYFNLSVLTGVLIVIVLI